MGIFDFLKKNKVVCPQCGHLNVGKARYCVRCGRAIPAMPQPAQPHHAAPVPQPAQPYHAASALRPASQPPHEHVPPPPAPAQPQNYGQAPAPIGDVPRAVYVADAQSGVNGMGYADEEWEGETMVLGAASADESETTILESPHMPAAYLVRSDTGERIPITKEQFILGRSSDWSDYNIADKTAISRRHAAIVFEGGRYFAVDMESSNKTYVDGMELSPGVGADLYSGSQVRLADLDFVFYLE
ncbi:MAG: FHA domain-containing protein [Clostridiales Family XIII bacterium]|jgi:hypothetical protein|nr:FHA domain-containing protein [Clostridiales Family XIII bacterium]